MGDRRTQDTVSAALSYAALGWPVFPVNSRKLPLTPHGKNDATLDRAVIKAWWARFPNAVPSIVTGAPSGVVALDIDIREAGSGFDTLEEMGIAFHPVTVTAHSPSGGAHCLFRSPEQHVATIAGKIGRFLDVRGDGGSLILPPGPGRFWDPVLGLDETPLAPMPEWMVLPVTSQPPRRRLRPDQKQPLSRYAEAALDGAVKQIVTAPCGEQYTTLNGQAFGIGGLVATGLISRDLALDSLHWAAEQMPSYDTHRPWRPTELRRIVERALTDARAHPRQEVRR